jgi:SAM-dependent methyltransferase
MNHPFIFDQPHYDALNTAREITLKDLLASLSKDMDLRTAADVGCGLGYFSNLLRAHNFEVLALDGRPSNIEEARQRCPGIQFRVADAEDAVIQSFGKFDVVLCFGLLYHLENPFVAVRNLFSMTGKLAVVEGMCFPGEEAVMAVRDEGPTEDQGLRHVALYPTENGLIKLLYRSGFKYAYRFRALPEHPDYQKSSLRKQVRTILAASITPLSSELLSAAEEPMTDPDPWAVRNSPAALARRARDTTVRLARFAARPWEEKGRILRRRWARLFPS